MNDNEANLIGVLNTNPILNTRVYKVDYEDGYRQALKANFIAENIFSQVEEQERRHRLLYSVIYVRDNGQKVNEKEVFIISHNGNKTQKHTSRGWDVCIQCKDVSASWSTLKEVKDSYPVDLNDFSVENRVVSQQAFVWWVPKTLNKREQIIN